MYNYKRLLFSYKVSNKHMVKKSLKRFHIDYYLVIKFLINTGLKRGFKYI